MVKTATRLMEPKANGEQPTKNKPMGTKSERVVIQPLEMQIVRMKIIFTKPYLQLRFSEKNKNKILKTMSEPTIQGRSSKKDRQARDYADDFDQAQYRDDKGCFGIPAAAFRNASIDACRSIPGMAMTNAKQTYFALEDTFDAKDLTPLVMITKGKPKVHTAAVRNANGSTDIRVRAIFWPCECILRVKFNSRMFDVSSIVNMTIHAGELVGVGEGRPNSRKSYGTGMGHFNVLLLDSMQA